MALSDTRGHGGRCAGRGGLWFVLTRERRATDCVGGRGRAAALSFEAAPPLRVWRVGDSEARTRPHGANQQEARSVIGGTVAVEVFMPVRVSGRARGRARLRGAVAGELLRRGGVYWWGTMVQHAQALLGRAPQRRSSSSYGGGGVYLSGGGVPSVCGRPVSRSITDCRVRGNGT